MAMSSRTRTRRVDWRTLVRHHEPPTPRPYPVYQFSNGRDFKDRNDPGKLDQYRRNLW